jgi:hypothetical protein
MPPDQARAIRAHAAARHIPITRLVRIALIELLRDHVVPGHRCAPDGYVYGLILPPSAHRQSAAAQHAQDHPTEPRSSFHAGAQAAIDLGLPPPSSLSLKTTTRPGQAAPIRELDKLDASRRGLGKVRARMRDVR